MAQTVRTVLQLLKYQNVQAIGVSRSDGEIELRFDTLGRDWRDYVKIKKDFEPEYRIMVPKPRTNRGFRVEILGRNRCIIENYDAEIEFEFMAETLGSLGDKLTTVKLKQWHTDNPARLESLERQEQQLQSEIDEFIQAAVTGRIPPDRLTFASNKVYTKEGNETREIIGNLGEIFSQLAETNCRLWHVQEKVYDFEQIPVDQKDLVIKELAIVNLERNHCIDELDKAFASIVTTFVQNA